MKFLPRIWLALITVLLLNAGGVVHGRMIYWGTGGEVEFRSSHGAAWSELERVTLGVFRTGFQPLRENRAEWGSHWLELGVAAYDPEEKRYAGGVDGANALPTGYSAQVYIWVADSKDLTSGPDWLLVTQPDWQWPGAGASSGLPALVWTTGDQGIVVVGSIMDGGRLLATVDVWPVPEDPTAWFGRLLGREPGPQGWGEDDDRDGVDNLGEYASGTDPKNPASRISPKLCLETAADGRWWNLEVERSPEAAVNLTLETSVDLSRWSEPASPPEILINRADQWKARGRIPETGDPGFFRFRYTLEEGAP